WAVAVYLESPVGAQYQMLPTNDIDRGVPKFVRRVIFATEHQSRMPISVGRNRIVIHIKPYPVFVSLYWAQRAQHVRLLARVVQNNRAVIPTRLITRDHRSRCIPRSPGSGSKSVSRQYRRRARKVDPA